jgi:hypothetical protein
MPKTYGSFFEWPIPMKLGEEILKRINKKFEPSTMVKLKFKAYDIALKTDENGDAIQAFIGKEKENGNIKGERFTRTLIYDATGKMIKNHWDRKGYSD